MDIKERKEKIERYQKIAFTKQGTIGNTTLFKRPPKGRQTKKMEMMFAVLNGKKVPMELEWTSSGLQINLPKVAIELDPSGKWDLVNRGK